MKLFGTLIVAAVVSMLLGGMAMLVMFTGAACWQSGCALSGMQQLALIPFYVGLGVVVFAAVGLRKRWQDAMFYALRLLMLIPVVLIVAGLAAGASPRARTAFDLGNAVLLSIPFWVVILSQWWIVRRALVQRGSSV